MPKGVYPRPPKKPFNPTKTSVNCISCELELLKVPSSIKRWSGFCRACTQKARRGTHLSDATKLKIKTSRLGKYGGQNHWNWQGGLTDPREIERVKFKRKLQKKILIRDDYTCQVCQQRGGNLQVDHIQKWSDFPELRFEEANCRTLCMACHYYVTFKKKIPTGIIWGHNFNKRMTS